MSLTELAIKRPTLVVVIFSVLTILGISSYTLLNYALIPSMNFLSLSIITPYPGASANEIETTVTRKLEDALSTLENVKDMRSTSQEGVSVISIELEPNSDVNVALQDAQRKINAALSSLPSGVKSPSIYKNSSDEIPVMQLGVTSGKLSPPELYQLAEDEIKPMISKLKGVGQVTLVGGSAREIRININKEKLIAYHVSIQSVWQAIGSANLEMPTGNIENDTRQYTVRLLGKVTSLDDLRNITVARVSPGSSIRLRDVADVTDGVAEQTALSRINGETSVGIVVQKQSDANTVDVCNKVKAELASLEQQYSADKLKFSIASDSSVYTLESANGVMEDLMLAILLVSLVMFVFLHSLRNSFIVLVSIPTSIISVFLAMYIFDFSLNLLTLMGLSLAIGILVDDSIVVLENIYRHMQMKKDKRTAALEGRNEIGFTAIAITTVDVVVFLPLALVTGIIGNMLREFSLVVVFTTLMSLFVSFTITPVLASRFGKLQQLTNGTLMGRFSNAVENAFHRLSAWYENILRWGLSHRKSVYFITTLLIVLSLSLFPMGFIGMSMMNDGDQSEFIIDLEGEPQNTIYQTSQLTSKVEALLMKKPEVQKVFSNIGFTSSASGISGSEKNKAQITVSLVPIEQRTISTEKFAAAIKKEVLQIPGLKVTATPTTISQSSSNFPIQVLLRGPDVNQLFKVGDSVMKIMEKVPGTTDVRLSVEKKKPEIHISLDREKMAQLGVNVQQVARLMNLSFAGNHDLQYSEGGTDYDINVMLDRFNREKINDIGSLTILNDKGQLVELKDFAAISQSLGPNKLERYDRISSLTVKCAVYGRPLGTVGTEVRQAVSQKIRPDGFTIDYKGQMERMSDAFTSLFTAMAAALIFVYLVMVALYNSYLYPFVVLFSIPVAVIGAFLALALSGEPVTVFTMIGMIMLIGLVAKNAILLVDFTNKLRAEGKSVKDALVAAGKERLRPILMTTFSMVFGMLPMALSSGASAEMKNGLAWVIIGGLTSSLLLTLVLVPSVYLTMERWKENVRKVFSKK